MLIRHFICTILLLLSVQLFAQSKEEIDWMELETYSSPNLENKINLYKKFIAKYPKSENAAEAKKRVSQLENEYAGFIYDKAISSQDPQMINDALKKFPRHRLAKKAQTNLIKLDNQAWAKVVPSDSMSLKQYMNNFPAGIHFAEAKQRYESDYGKDMPIQFAKVQDRSDIQSMNIKQLQSFVQKNPNGNLAREARQILDKKEQFYYDQAIRQESNYNQFKQAVSKSQILFPGTERSKDLLKRLAVKDEEYKLNANKPDYVAWQNLNKANLSELNSFVSTYPNSEFKEKGQMLINALDDKQYKLVLARKSLSEIDKYIKVFPNGAHLSEVNQLKTKLTSDPKFKEFSNIKSQGNKEAFKEFAFENKESQLKESAIREVTLAEPLRYHVRKEDDAIIISIINFDEPYLILGENADIMTIDSTDLKELGEIAINFESSYENYTFRVRDSNGREVEIDFSKDLNIEKLEDGDVIKILIEGGVPPYTIEFFNTDLNLAQKYYEDIALDSNNTFVVSKDTLKDLAGNYDISIKTITAQEARITGIFFEDKSGRKWKSAIFSIVVLSAIVAVIYVYIKRSKQKTVFDEFE